MLKMMRKLVYSRTNEEFNNELQTMRSSQTFLKYENYAQHINEKILPRRDEWSLLFRIESQLPTNNVNTSNYAEVSFRVTKDLKFNRHRAFNQLELLTIECDDSAYYIQRCIDVASNTLTSRLVKQNSRFLNRRAVAIDTDKIRRETDGTFTVPSETKKDVEYTVDMELRICSCPDGLSRGPCKHRKIVATSQNLASFDIIPETNPEMRKIWMELGTGKKMSIDYFLPLSNPYQTSEERSFEEDIEMRVEDENEGFEDEEMIDEERGQLRNSRVEVAENHEKRIDNAKGKLATLLQTMNNMFAERIPHDVEGYEKALKSLESHLKKLPTTKDSALQKALHTFGEQQTESLRGGKRKKRNSIPVQATARSRRKYKMRGSRVAPGGQK